MNQAQKDILDRFIEANKGNEHERIVKQLSEALLEAER